MKTFIQKKIPELSPDAQIWTPSTLLIPDKLMSYYFQRCSALGSRRFYFRHLIQVYGFNLDYYLCYPQTNKWKKKYQNEDLDLQNLNFTPFPSDWEEYRNIGLAYGLSICHLFVFLLTLEYNRYIKAGCPENFVESPPSRRAQRKRRGKTRSAKNSLQIVVVNARPGTEDLKLSLPGTTLIRNIDSSRRILHRIAWKL